MNIQTSLLDNIKKSYDDNALGYPESLINALEITSAYKAEPFNKQEFINLLKEKYSGKNLSSIATKYLYYENIFPPESKKLNKTDYYKLMLAGDPDQYEIDALFETEFNDFMSTSEVSPLLEEFLADKEFISRLNNENNKICDLSNAVYAFTRKGVDESFENIKKYYKRRSPEDDYKYEENLNLIQKNILGLFLLRESGLNSNMVCFNGKMPKELIQQAVDEGLIKVDENPLTHTILDNRCTVPRGEIDLLDICDLSEIINEVNLSQKDSQSNRLADSTNISITSPGECTIAVLDKNMSGVSLRLSNRKEDMNLQAPSYEALLKKLNELFNKKENQ